MKIKANLEGSAWPKTSLFLKKKSYNFSYELFKAVINASKGKTQQYTNQLQ